MSPRLALAVMIAFFALAPARAESFKSWAARGAREVREKDSKAAFASYSNALTLWEARDGAKSKAKVLCARAGLREKQGDGSGAFKDLSDCLKLDKKNSQAFHRRGVLLLNAGKTAAAIGDFYRAVALNIRFAQAYADRARAYEKQGELGFAREDYRLACNYGVKSVCAKAKKIPPGHAKKAAKASTAPDEPEDEPEPMPGPETPPKPAAARPASAPSSYNPKFKDCLTKLDECIENGDSFGACVRSTPDCDEKAVKGCCPSACLNAYRKALNSDRSEAAAYREHFTPGAACGTPPKVEEE